MNRIGSALGLVALTAIVGCTKQRPSVAETPSPSDESPAAWVRLAPISSINTRLEFSVAEESYVIVGHLGLDGVVRVVYPGDPAADNRVRANKVYRTKGFDVNLGLPDVRGAARIPWRSIAARDSSYDGQGYRFAFIIASREKLQYDALRDGSAWASIDADDYGISADPQLVARFLGSEIVRRGAPFTLAFAPRGGSSYRVSHFACARAAARNVSCY